MKSLAEAQSELLRTEAALRQAEKDVIRLRQYALDLRSYISQIRDLAPPGRYSHHAFAYMAILEILREKGPQTREEIFQELKQGGFPLQANEGRARGDILKSIQRNAAPQKGKEGEVPARFKILPDGRVDVA